MKMRMLSKTAEQGRFSGMPQDGKCKQCTRKRYTKLSKLLTTRQQISGALRCDGIHGHQYQRCAHFSATGRVRLFRLHTGTAIARPEHYHLDWIDVDGVLIFDPRRVPNAFVLPEVSFTEGMELAYFSAKVIHPKIMQPAILSEPQIPFYIRNTFNISFRGFLLPPPRIPKSLCSLKQHKSMLHGQFLALFLSLRKKRRTFPRLFQDRKEIILDATT